MTDAIQDAIAQAQKTAQASIAAQAGAVATASHPASTAVAPLRGGTALSMQEMLIGDISVDQWVGVKEFGFIFGKEKTLVARPIEVEIDMAAVAVCYAVKYGNPAIYDKTYDRVLSSKGGSWMDAMEKATRIDPNAREYRSADIPMVLTDDVTVADGKGKDLKVLAGAGQTLGYSLSTTNWTAWAKFFREVSLAGLDRSIVKAEIGFEKKTNSKGNVWGIMNFTLIQPATVN